jgi:hypothetical protein
MDMLGQVPFQEDHDTNRYDKMIKMKTFSSCYLARYFIFWEEESTDYLRMFTAPLYEDPDTLMRLEQIASELSEELLSDKEIADNPPLSYLYGITGSQNYDSFNHVKQPGWELEYYKQVDDGEEDVLIGVRSQAPKRAGEIRDIICPNPCSRRRHKRLCWHMAKACKKIFMCPFGGNSEDIDRTMAWMNKSYYWFMRDYEKCGLTFPHPVIKAIFKGFFARRPDLAEMGIKFLYQYSAI